MSKKVKTVLTVLIILNLIFIWGNSILPAEQSNDVSIKAMETVDKTVGVTRKEPLDKESPSIQVIRKLAHILEFMCLGVLLSLRLSKLKLMPVYSFTVCVCVASIDEIIQKFSGRSDSLADVLIDSGGAAVGVLAVWIIICIVKRKSIHLPRYE